MIDARIFLPGGGVALGGNSGSNAVPVYRPTVRCERGLDPSAGKQRAESVGEE